MASQSATMRAPNVALTYAASVCPYTSIPFAIEAPLVSTSLEVWVIGGHDCFNDCYLLFAILVLQEMYGL